MKYLLLLSFVLFLLFVVHPANAQPPIISASPTIFYCVGNNPQPPCATIAPTQAIVNNSLSASQAPGTTGTVSSVSGTVSPSLSSSVPPTETSPNPSGKECPNLSQIINTLDSTQTSSDTRTHIKCEPSNSGGGNTDNPNNGLLSQLITLIIQLIMQLLQSCGVQSPNTGTPTVSIAPSPVSSISSTPTPLAPSSVISAAPAISSAPPGTGGTTLKIGTTAPPSGTNAVVDFRTNLAVPALNTYSIGDTISEFGSPNNNIQNATWRGTLAKLGPLAWRIALRYKNNTAVGGAGGGDNGNGANYIKDIRAMNGVPVIIVAGDTGDYDINQTTAKELVQFFNNNGGQNGGPVTAWIIGNEPGGSYWGQLGAAAQAIATADPSIPVTISAPAIADMTQGFGNGGSYQQAVQDAGQYLTYLSYHAYVGGDGKGVYATPEYLATAEQVKQTYNKTPGLEEFNWNSSCAGNGAGYSDWESTVYIASIIGNSVAGGAHAYMYADSGGCGTLSNGSNNGGIQAGTPLPAYWALGIWTGMNGEFDRFGSQLVSTSVGGVIVTDATGKEATGLAHEVELYATNNGKIVAINKNANAENMTIGLGGITTGTYNVWQTNPNTANAAITEVKGNTNFSGSEITISLPGHTVSSIDVQ